MICPKNHPNQTCDYKQWAITNQRAGNHKTGKLQNKSADGAMLIAISHVNKYMQFQSIYDLEVVTISSEIISLFALSAKTSLYNMYWSNLFSSVRNTAP